MLFKLVISMVFIIKLDDLAKAKVVQMIFDKKTEEALQSLGRFYKVNPPKIVVGTIKGKDILCMLYMFKKSVKFIA